MKIRKLPRRLQPALRGGTEIAKPPRIRALAQITLKIFCVFTQSRGIRNQNYVSPPLGTLRYTTEIEFYDSAESSAE
jgi:hypothetical protein